MWTQYQIQYYMSIFRSQIFFWIGFVVVCFWLLPVANEKKNRADLLWFPFAELFSHILLVLFRAWVVRISKLSISGITHAFTILSHSLYRRRKNRQTKSKNWQIPSIWTYKLRTIWSTIKQTKQKNTAIGFDKGNVWHLLLKWIA